ncbi:MAG TPA: hypothetical protein VHC23_05315, partial [Jatrophihabitans sp.]|nr:hypothetical protein [Jatrophihabitans sp.]
WTERVVAAVRGTALPTPVATGRAALPAASVRAAAAAARADGDRLDRRREFRAAAGSLAGLAGVALLAAVGFGLAGRRVRVTQVAPAPASGALARS